MLLYNDFTSVKWYCNLYKINTALQYQCVSIMILHFDSVPGNLVGTYSCFLWAYRYLYITVHTELLSLRYYKTHQLSHRT